MVYTYTTTSNSFNVRCVHAESANERRLREESARLTAALRELQVQIPRLVQLCHPDKHHQSPAATEATQWLLVMRALLAPPRAKEAA